MVMGGELPPIAAPCGKRAAMRGKRRTHSGHANEQVEVLRSEDDAAHFALPDLAKKIGLAQHHRICRHGFLRLVQSTLMPANLMTFAHLSVSDATNAPNSFGDIGIGVPPMSTSLSLRFA